MNLGHRNRGQERTAARDFVGPRLRAGILLDVGLPDISGLEVARRIRASGSEVAILMLTARDTVGDRVTGLDAGADDYLVKPFAYEELAARLRALGRRGAASRASSSKAGWRLTCNR